MPRFLLALCRLLARALSAQGAAETCHPATAAVLAIPQLVSFWDFQEATGIPRVAKGLHAAALVDGGTPVQQAEGGLFGRHCAQFKAGQ